METLSSLTTAGLLPVLDAALLRYKRDGKLGRSRPNLTPQVWEALARLTGEKANGVLDLAVLDAALRRSRYGVGLPDVLEELHGGPVIPAHKQHQNWRMDAQAYALACSRGTVALSGSVEGYAELFPDLVREMQARGAGAHQENLLPELLADLGGVIPR